MRGEGESCCPNWNFGICGNQKSILGTTLRREPLSRLGSIVKCRRTLDFFWLSYYLAPFAASHIQTYLASAQGQWDI